MKQGYFTGLLLVLAYAVSFAFYAWMGTMPDGSLFHEVWKGGVVVTVLIALILLVITYSVERIVVLHRIAGRNDGGRLLRELGNLLERGDIDMAVATCSKIDSLTARVVGSVLHRYRLCREEAVCDRREMVRELEKASDVASGRELPQLEEHLPILATLASISTMVGLLGTTLGMIRSFAAMATTGAPDTASLSLGISEALFNTALGIVGGILGMVSFNLLSDRVEQLLQRTDDAVAVVVGLLETMQQRNGKGA